MFSKKCVLYGYKQTQELHLGVTRTCVCHVLHYAHHQEGPWHLSERFTSLLLIHRLKGLRQAHNDTFLPAHVETEADRVPPGVSALKSGRERRMLSSCLALS